MLCHLLGNKGLSWCLQESWWDVTGGLVLYFSSGGKIIWWLSFSFYGVWKEIRNRIFFFLIILKSCRGIISTHFSQSWIIGLLSWWVQRFEDWWCFKLMWGGGREENWRTSWKPLPPGFLKFRVWRGKEIQWLWAWRVQNDPGRSSCLFLVQLGQGFKWSRGWGFRRSIVNLAILFGAPQYV